MCTAGVRKSRRLWRILMHLIGRPDTRPGLFVFPDDLRIRKFTRHGMPASMHFRVGSIFIRIDVKRALWPVRGKQRDADPAFAVGPSVELARRASPSERIQQIHRS